MNHPAARCAAGGYAHQALVFERSSVTKYGWACHCPTCHADDDWRNVTWYGTGRDANEALESYAGHNGTRASELLEPREKHV